MNSGSKHLPEADKFEYIRKLGSGGFGEVWLASDRQRGEDVAVKFLHLDHGTPGDVEVFKREFQILSELKQVHLARVFDFGFNPEKEQYFLSTEFCPGQKLLEALQGKPVEYYEEILVQLLTALECIHSQGIIHFDIKPDNILVQDQDGHPNVKLVDFGVAVRLQAIPEQLGGTLAYIAPEVIERSTKLDHRVDLYALGMLSLFCLAKKLPFVAGSPKHVIDWHQKGGLQEQHWNHAEVPPYLREMTEKLLAKNPSDRFSNARVILNFINLATGGKYRQAEEDLPAQIPIEGPLVERREKVLVPIQNRILRALNDSEHPDAKKVFYICGERGIGKSRVLEEIRHFLQVNEIPLFKLDCDWNIPSWPKLEQWLASPAPSGDDLNQEWQTRRRVDALFETARKRPFCLLIDDFHKADQEMQELIAECQNSEQSAPLMILLNSEEIQEPGLTLDRLSLEGISQYLHLVLGESVPIDHLAEVLQKYSGGLPVLMVEGLRFLAPHFFRGDDLEGLLQPDKIRDLYADKLAQLSPQEEELLLLVSLIFRPVTETELNAILQVSSGELIERAGKVFQLGLLSGNLYGEALFRVSSQALALDLVGNLDEARRTQLHGKIAAGLSQLQDIPQKEMAYHLAKAGLHAQATEQYTQAAADLERGGKVASACECLQNAAQIMEPGSENWEALILKVFRMLVLSGHYQQAQEVSKQLEDYPSWKRDETRGWLFFKLRQFPIAREHYQRALTQVPESDRLNHVLIENALGNIELQEGRFADSAARFRKTYEWEEDLSPEEQDKVHNNNLGLALAMLAEHDSAMEFFEDRLDDTPEHKTAERLTLLNGMGFACLKASKYEETISYLKRAMVLAEESGALHALFSVMGNLMTALLKENRYVEALSILKKIDSYQRRFGTKKDVAHNLMRQGSVYLMLGMGEFARECFEEGLAISKNLGENLLAGWFSLMLAYWEREFGGAEGAVGHFQAAREWAEAEDNHELLAWAQYGLADHYFEENELAESQRQLEGMALNSQDHEFEIRMRLLKAKWGLQEHTHKIFTELESECQKFHYKELLWELYHAWGLYSFKKKQKDAALELMSKGMKIIEEIANALPEEYRFRYLNQRSRKRLADDLEQHRASASGGFFHKIFRSFPKKLKNSPG